MELLREGHNVLLELGNGLHGIVPQAPFALAGGGDLRGHALHALSMMSPLFSKFALKVIHQDAPVVRVLVRGSARLCLKFGDTCAHGITLLHHKRLSGAMELCRFLGHGGVCLSGTGKLSVALQLAQLGGRARIDVLRNLDHSIPRGVLNGHGRARSLSAEL
jgi:hypothetical protein